MGTLLNMKGDDKMYSPALDLIYNDVAISSLGLRCADIKSSSTEELDMGANYKIIEDSTNKNTYVFGTIETDSKLKFDLPLMTKTKTPLDEYDIALIVETLSSPINVYNKLQYIYDDMTDKYVMARLNNPKKILIGTKCYGIRFDVECMDGYWYENYNTRNILATNTTQTIEIYNDTNKELDTIITIKPTVLNSQISITNLANGVNCNISQLKTNETIILNSKKSTIVSNQVQYNFDRFNLNWITLMPKLNKIEIMGNNVNVEIKYQFKRRG